MNRLFAIILALSSGIALSAQEIPSSRAAMPASLYVVGAITVNGIETGYNFDGIEFEKEGELMICRDVTFHVSTGEIAEFAITVENTADRWQNCACYVPGDSEFRGWNFSGDYTLSEPMMTSKNRIMNITPGTYNLTMDFSENAPVMTITRSDVSYEDLIPSALYIIGNVQSSESGDAKAAQINYTGREFINNGDGCIVCNNVVLYAADAQNQFAEFAIVENNTYESWLTGLYYTTSPTTWMLSDDVTYETRPVTTNSSDGGVRTMTIAPGEYDFSIDYSSFKPVLTISKSSKIPTGTDLTGYNSTSPTLYYNLQGIPVATPTHGIFIMRKDGTARTISIK